MNSTFRSWLLRGIAAAFHFLNRQIIFRLSAQTAHDGVITLLRLMEQLPLTPQIASAMRHLTCSEVETEVGGVRLTQRLILAAGLVKGDGFSDEKQALRAVNESRRNIIPGWRIVPALVGPVEFGSFTRYPRKGNPGTVVWRHEKTQSTQNRVGLRNPGARAAALFLGKRRDRLPREFGINIAVSPGVP